MKIISTYISQNNVSLYCSNCSKLIHSDPILCYIFIDYFCTKQCHSEKHKMYLRNVNVH